MTTYASLWGTLQFIVLLDSFGILVWCNFKTSSIHYIHFGLMRLVYVLEQSESITLFHGCIFLIIRTILPIDLRLLSVSSIQIRCSGKVGELNLMGGKYRDPTTSREYCLVIPCAPLEFQPPQCHQTFGIEVKAKLLGNESVPE